MADNQFINFNSQDVADMYRRNQYARMLQDQANAPIERASYKGIEAPIHPVQGVAKLAAALLAGHQQNQMDERYSNEKAAAEQKLVAEQERSNQAYNEFEAGLAPKPGFGASGSVEDYGGQEMMPKPRSDAERLAHLMRSRGSPDERIRSSAKNYLDYDAAQVQEKTRLDERERDRLDTQAQREQDQKNKDRTFKQTELASERSYNQQANRQPPLNKGERYNKETDTVEQIPGSQAYLKNKGLHAADLSSAQLTSSIDDNLGSNISKLLASPGFDSIFGIAGGLTPNVLPEAKSAATLRKQVMDAMGPAGMLINKGAVGSIGTMALGEWDKVASYIAAIKDTDNPEDARKAFENALIILKRTKQIATDKYENEWGGSQYDTRKASSNGKQDTVTTASSVAPMFANNGKSRITSTDGGKTWKEIR
jgi:hypothetical protein